jgi:hypothetical protein
MKHFHALLTALLSIPNIFLHAGKKHGKPSSRKMGTIIILSFVMLCGMLIAAGVFVTKILNRKSKQNNRLFY